MKRPLFSYKLIMVFKFNTAKAISYANNYKDRINPFYAAFNDGQEGCNFISQCLFAGCENMTSKSCPDWFYESERNYSESWCNQDKLLKYLLNQHLCGPVGRMINKALVTIGDVVFWKEKDGKVGVGIVSRISEGEIFFISKSFFYSEDMLSKLENNEVVFVHIIGVKK